MRSLRLSIELKHVRAVSLPRTLRNPSTIAALDIMPQAQVPSMESTARLSKSGSHATHSPPARIEKVKWPPSSPPTSERGPARHCVVSGEQRDAPLAPTQKRHEGLLLKPDLGTRKKAAVSKNRLQDQRSTTPGASDVLGGHVEVSRELFRWSCMKDVKRNGVTENLGASFLDSEMRSEFRGSLAPQLLLGNAWAQDPRLSGHCLRSAKIATMNGRRS